MKGTRMKSEATIWMVECTQPPCYVVGVRVDAEASSCRYEAL